MWSWEVLWTGIFLLNSGYFRHKSEQLWQLWNDAGNSMILLSILSLIQLTQATQQLTVNGNKISECKNQQCWNSTGFYGCIHSSVPMHYLVTEMLTIVYFISSGRHLAIWHLKKTFVNPVHSPNHCRCPVRLRLGKPRPIILLKKTLI